VPLLLFPDTANGKIKHITRKKVKNGTPYASVCIDGKHYTCWDTELIARVKPGRKVGYQWDQSSKFKKIVDIEPALDGPDLSPNKLRILRMSAPRLSSYLEISADLPLEGKTRTTLNVSRAFERYIVGMLTPD